MPLYHFVHVVGFDVPVDQRLADGLLVVLLDKTPVDTWRETFTRHASELAPELRRGPPTLVDNTLRFPTRTPMTRRHAGEIRAFVDRLNRLAFPSDSGIAVLV